MAARVDASTCRSGRRKLKKGEKKKEKKGKERMKKKKKKEKTWACFFILHLGLFFCSMKITCIFSWVGWLWPKQIKRNGPMVFFQPQ
ncbi:unnamed protein product [Coffea canephora]|uniref:Uncharacterized protein n=1 Tax=Coffea canephora TaxID=49390 RepID=A0A068UTE7_COFCA|nr:unnamed protein product [Coffea canephora]